MGIPEGFSPIQYAQLVGETECFIHRHPREPSDFIDRVDLMAAEPVRDVVGVTTYDITRADELLLVDTSASSVTIQTPAASRGREFQIVKMTPQNALIVLPAAGETILGSTSGAIIYGQFTSLHLKAISGGYILK